MPFAECYPSYHMPPLKCPGCATCVCRVRFLGTNLQPLHEVVDPSGLPSELGGSLQQDNPMEWLEQQMEQQQQVRVPTTRAAALQVVRHYVLKACPND